jgi:large subunit ribosomal protein L13
MSTYFPKPGEIVRKWFVVDADGQTLGRMASQVARILMGKENPQYTPFLDTGDHVIVINAEKVKLTGRKDAQKVYRSFTGYPGGLVETGAQKVRATRPARMVEEAISGMLPKTKLGKQMYRKLKVYAGDKHPHAAQQPAALTVARSANATASKAARSANATASKAARSANATASKAARSANATASKARKVS